MNPRLCCVLLLAAACTPSLPSGSGDDVRLAVEPETVSAGDSITLVLMNGSAAPIGYNLCTTGLERRTGGGWQALPSDRICTMELRMLPPGEEARYKLELPAGLAPGDYRARTNVERAEGAGAGSVASGAFRVGA